MKANLSSLKRYYCLGAEHLAQLIANAIGKGLDSVEINNLIASHLTQLEQWEQSPQAFPPPNGYDLLQSKDEEQA